MTLDVWTDRLSQNVGVCYMIAHKSTNMKFLYLYVLCGYVYKYMTCSYCRIRRLRCVSSHKQIVGIQELLVSARQILSSSS